MDPATEIATLVVSYLWPLHELCPEVDKVEGFRGCEDTLANAAHADHALVSRLREVADREDEERWSAPADRGAARVTAAPSETLRPEDESPLPPKLRTFWRQAVFLAHPVLFGRLVCGHDTTRDGFARAVLERLFKRNLVVAVARKLDYVPIVVRRIAARARDLSRADCEKLLDVSGANGP